MASPPPGVRCWAMHINRVSLVVIVVGVSLLAAACGDDGSTVAAPAASQSPAATTASPTTAAPTTSAAETTSPPTTAAPATTAAPTTAAPAESPLPEGPTTGRWNNTTFGSTGAAVSDVSRTGDTLSISVDLTDGFAFGSGIGDLFSLDLPLDQLVAGVTVETVELGTLTIKIVDGKVDVVGTNAPFPGISGFTATGTITDSSLSGTYEVQFDIGDPAVGTFEFPIG